MIWYSITEDASIPDWLKSKLPSKCAYCGKPMLAGHNDVGRITGLRCEDMNCPSMIACRIVFIFEVLEIKGYGFSNAYNLVKANKYTHPIEALTILKEKPTMTLGKYLRCNCIQGIDGEWEVLADKADCYTLDEMYEAYPDNEYLIQNKEMLYNNLKYVNLAERQIKKARTVIPIVIMITGTPVGFNTKEHFVSSCNEFCQGEYRIIHQKTPKQGGVHFLIREEGSTTRGKVEVAKKANIPIVTSKEFMQVLSILMKEAKPDENH